MLDWPAGQVIVVIAGLVFIGVGLDQARKGLKKQFLEDSKTERDELRGPQGVHRDRRRRATSPA